MTFTELELVLGVGLAIVLYINNRLIKEINSRRAEREHMINMMIGVAEKRYRLQRHKEGVEVINLENSNAQASNQN